MHTWVVLVEAEREAAATVLAVEQLEHLLELLGDHSPSGLWSVDRYALQFVLEAPSPEAALITGLGQWREASARAGLAAWSLVRVELKTPAELEAEHRAAATDDGPGNGAPTSDEALRAAYLATRRLLYCGSREEAAAIVSDLARRLGATLVDAGGDPSALPLDLSLGTGRPRLPVADEISMTRLDLEEVLPTAMLDATQAVRLVESPYSSSRRRSSSVSRRTTTRAVPSATNTTAGRGTLL